MELQANTMMGMKTTNMILKQSLNRSMIGTSRPKASLLRSFMVEMETDGIQSKKRNKLRRPKWTNKISQRISLKLFKRQDLLSLRSNKRMIHFHLTRSRFQNHKSPCLLILLTLNLTQSSNNLQMMILFLSIIMEDQSQNKSR